MSNIVELSCRPPAAQMYSWIRVDGAVFIWVSDATAVSRLAWSGRSRRGPSRWPRGCSCGRRAKEVEGGACRRSRPRRDGIARGLAPGHADARDETGGMVGAQRGAFVVVWWAGSRTAVWRARSLFQNASLI